MPGHLRSATAFGAVAMAAALAAALVFAGCASRKPAPPGTMQTGQASTADAVQPLAVMPVHVTYTLRALTPSLDSLFPTQDSLTRAACQNAAGLICHQYVYRRDPLQLTATGDRVSIATKLQYRARVSLPGARLASCGYAPQPMRRASLAMTTSLYWRRDWRIGARQTTMQATLDDQCRVTALSIDATPALRNIIDDQLALFAAQADSAIPLVADLKPLADSLWRSFVEPTALDSAGLLWLLLEPEAVRVAPLVGIGPSFKTAITLYARPRVVAGARPVVRQRALPELSMSPAPANFEVPVTVELPFAELERQTTALLVPQTRESSVRVDGVYLSGRGDSVRVELDVSGALRGRLALVSKMRWDPAARELRLDDLAWTLDSKGALARVKASIAAPLIGRALRRATMGGRVPLGAQLDSARAQLLTKVNATLGPGVAIGGSVGDVQIVSLQAVDRAFVVRARFTGQAGVWIQ